MRRNVESNRKDQYTRPIFDKAELNNNEVTIILSKEDKKDNKIKSEYLLKYDKKNANFEIVQYKDI